MKRIIYIPFDHLHRKFGALKDADRRPVPSRLSTGIFSIATKRPLPRTTA